MVKSNMTVGKLAEATQREFSQVYERFDQVDERLDKIDTTLKAVLEVVLEIPSKKAFERTQTRNEARFGVIEKKIGV